MAIISVHGILTYLTSDSPQDVVAVFVGEWFDDCQLIVLVVKLALHWKVVLMVLNLLLCGCFLRLCAVVVDGAVLFGTLLCFDWWH